MKRVRNLAVVLLLASCSSQTGALLGTGQPSLNSAKAALEAGAPSVALGICTSSVATHGPSVPALACQGDALTAMGRQAEAVAAYHRALALDPRSTRALLGIGRLSLPTDPKLAEKLFLTGLAETPRDAVLLNDLGIAQDLQGRHADAQQSYAAAVAADPDMRAAQVNMALSMALQGRSADGARLLGPLAAGPNATARERHDMAAILAMNGRTDEAKDLLRPELQGADLDAAIAGYRAVHSLDATPQGVKPP